MTGLKSRSARVLLIAYGGETNPSTRLRVLQYVPSLAAEGFTFETVFMAPGDSATKSIAQKLARSDVILVQRFLSRELLQALRRSGKPIVFDLDDALHYIRPPQYFRAMSPSDIRDRIAILYRLVGRGGRYYSRRRKLLRSMLDLATVVVAGNDWLRKDLGLSAPKAVVIPTAVWMDRADCKIHRHRRPVTLGWIGGWGSLYHLDLLTDTFQRLQHRFSGAVELKIVSSEPYDAPIQTRFEPWSLQTEDEAVLSFDIGLMPVHNDPFSHGKCAFKAIYCMSRGIPVVASPVGANCELISHGRNGYLATTTAEWYESLSTLVEDVELRTRMGQCAYSTVQERYSADAAAKALADVLRTATLDCS